MNRKATVAVAVAAVTFIIVLSLDFGVTHPGNALEAVASLLAGMGQPDLRPQTLLRVSELAAQTIAVAVLGTGLGAGLGLMLAMVGATASVGGHRAPGRRVLAEVLRLGLDGLRAIPDFAWALALLVVLGPGPLTGTFAIAVSVTGILGRAFGQLLESVPEHKVQGVERLAGSPMAAVIYGRLPHIAPAAWSYGLARLECSIRNASVIGIVGGGGLGAELFEELGYGRMDRVATLLMGLVILTAVADVGSGMLRRGLGGVGLRARRSALHAALLVSAASLAWLTPAAFELIDALARLDLRVAAASGARLLQPDLSRQTLGEVFRGVGAPVGLAWLSMGAATGVALMFLPWTSTGVRRRAHGVAASDSRLAVFIAWLLRGLALLARAVPEVAWLLLFAAALGMGPLPAVLALGLHASGILVRLFTEAVDDRFGTAPHRGIGAGAGVGWLVYAALPRLRGTLATHTALQAESNLRSAFTLGILGAGGLGNAFHSAISYWQLERASTLALGMLVLFVGLDRAGRRLSRLVG
ncbi:MAG: ABC transporter permease subunit [Nannocystales bacterium]